MRLALLLALLATAASAQTTVRGRVTDAATGAGLPAATVQVEGTSRGTITNAEGEFSLAVDEPGAVIVVRFLGYETARQRASDRLDVALAPAVAELGEAVVTAGNPADAIMRRVIERKALWRGGLETWRAEVYSRQTIRASGAVVALIEGQTEAFWDAGHGLREVVTATRRTGNLAGVPLDAFAAAEQVLNLYDDEVEFGGYDLMGPTSPDALGFYTFTLAGSRALGTQLVYDVAFAPKNPLQPGLEGTVSVLADADAMLAISARPSGAVQFPLVNQFELTLDQQFATFGQSAGGEAVWLPADFRMSGAGRLGNALVRFPDIGFAVASRFTDYAVNVAVPDSLFAQDRVLVDSASVARALPVAGVVPLSAEEERALAEIDSTLSLAEAVRPSGPLARFFNVSFNVDPPGGGASGARGVRLGASPDVGYNRVEGVWLGGEGSARLGRLSATAGAAYQTERDDVSVEGGLTARLGRGFWAGADGHRRVEPVASSFYVGDRINSVAAITLGEDYFDYVEALGGSAWAGWWGGDRVSSSARVRVAYDEVDDLRVQTGYSLSGRDLPPANATLAPFGDAEVARVETRFQIGEVASGLESGVTGQRGATLRVELGRQWLGLLPPRPTEDYFRVEGDVRWAAPTVLRRRLLAPTLHVRLAGGVAAGELPLLRAFGIDGQLAGLAPFGALRARTGRLTLADRYALVAWEHDFRSVPFELLGWRGAAPRGLSVQVHGAHAWAEGAPGATRVEPSVVHHEVGASVGLGYVAPVRLDLTYRLTDEPGLVFGFGVARLF